VIFLQAYALVRAGVGCLVDVLLQGSQRDHSSTLDLYLTIIWTLGPLHEEGGLVGNVRALAALILALYPDLMAAGIPEERAAR